MRGSRHADNVDEVHDGNSKGMNMKGLGKEGTAAGKGKGVKGLGKDAFHRGMKGMGKSGGASVSFAPGARVKEFSPDDVRGPGPQVQPPPPPPSTSTAGGNNMPAGANGANPDVPPYLWPGNI